MLLSIIIPVYNEVGLVTTLLGKVEALELEGGLEKEIVIVDDGSSDGTRELLSEYVASRPGLKLLLHEKNKGKGAAVRTGMEAAKGDIFIIQDADLEYDPEDILKVVAPIQRGDCQVVYGSRILMEKALGRAGFYGWLTGKHPHSYVLAYIGGVVITQFTNLLTGASLTDEPTCYKCFHRSSLEGIDIECDDFSWEPEVTIKILLRNIAIAEVPISYHPRKNNEGKKINWRHGVKALGTLMKYRIQGVGTKRTES